MPLCFTEMIAFCCLKRWVTVFNKYWNTACLKNTHSHLLKQIARSSKRKASMPTNDALSCIGHGLLQKMPWLRSYLLQGVLSWDSCYIFLCMGSQNANVSPFRKGIPYLLWKVCRKNKMEYSPENSHFTKKTKNSNWLPCWLTHVKIHERDKVPCWCWGIWTFLDTFWALFIST